MPRPLLPPRGIFLTTVILFDKALSSELRDTLFQLMALAWGSDAHMTPPPTFRLLEQLTGKKARTLRGHLASLRLYKAVLRLQPAGERQFIIQFAEWLYVDPGKLPSFRALLDEDPAPDEGDSQVGRILPMPVNDNDHDQYDDEDLSTLSEEKNLHYSHNDLDHDHKDTEVQKPASKGSRKKSPEGVLTPKLKASLTEAGVYSALFDEIAQIASREGLTAKDLLALIAWCKEEAPQKPGGLFVSHLRKNMRPPRKYYQPACPVCGKRGGHDPDCRRRYIVDYDKL